MCNDLNDLCKFLNDIIVNDMSVYQLKKIINNHKIVIYGAGYLGVITYRAFKKLGLEPICFADKYKYNTELEGKLVIKPEEIYENFGDAFIVVSMYSKSNLYEQIKNMLMKYNNKNIVHILQLRNCTELMKSQPLPLYIDSKFMLNNKEKITNFYDGLNDEFSKKTLISLIKFITYDYDEDIYTLPLKEQYFAYDLYKKEYNEVFVDCGAFIGEVLDEFFKNVNGKFNKYIAYEPDKMSYNKLRCKIEEKYNLNSNIDLFNLALSDKEEMLRFENYGQANSSISNTGNEIIKSAVLDEHLKFNMPTFIKIDVEGYDKQVLYGAKETIKRCMPVIAVSIYHNIDDLWEIPLWIKENFPEYKLYIRSYMNYMETVCYAVPPDRIVK